VDFAEDPPRRADEGGGAEETPHYTMIHPVSSVHASHASQVSQPAARQPQPKQSSAEVQDKVSLQSTKVDVDHDGGSK